MVKKPMIPPESPPFFGSCLASKLDSALKKYMGFCWLMGWLTNEDPEWSVGNWWFLSLMSEIGGHACWLIFRDSPWSLDRTTPVTLPIRSYGTRSIGFSIEKIPRYKSPISVDSKSSLSFGWSLWFSYAFRFPVNHHHPRVFFRAKSSAQLSKRLSHTPKRFRTGCPGGPHLVAPPANSVILFSEFQRCKFSMAIIYS